MFQRFDDIQCLLSIRISICVNDENKRIFIHFMIMIVQKDEYDSFLTFLSLNDDHAIQTVRSMHVCLTFSNVTFLQFSCVASNLIVTFA